MKQSHVRLSTNEKVGFVKNLHTMLSAGIPILEAVESLREDSKGNQKILLDTLKEDLNQGKHIFFTLDKFPKVFDKVTVSILKASEEAGTLDVALKDLADSIRKDTEFKDKVKNALLYPVVILGVFVIVFVLLLVVVIPKIADVFSRLDVVLPLPTKILIFISNIILHNTIFVVLGLFFLIGTFIVFYRAKREVFVQFLFTIPIISQLAVQIDLTKLSRSLYLLLSAGIPITDALELVENVVAKREVKRVVKTAHQTVQSGRPLSYAFKANKKTVPIIMTKITEAGEKSGSLDKSFLDLTEYLDYQVSKTLHTITTLLEPIMLVGVAILIGGMMLAIIAPIYGLIGQVSNR